MRTKLFSIAAFVFCITFISSYIDKDYDSHNLTASNHSDTLDCGLTDDFIKFLDFKGICNIHLGYSSYNFNRTDVKCGSYGGRRTSS